ncbi:hypothetical protein GCM10010249_30870 [Streptomyces roseolilacinus]|uniref:Uncharacterized protein n=1 Tax=Streptomyces roseolilacinus TaxID=66904 RepID=A0A918B0A0_9ACTN|nr:hypothetical protein GCM10010249_30870 [Streptomyces roseolilacinus]
MASRRGLSASNRSTSFMVSGMARILAGQRGRLGALPCFTGRAPGGARTGGASSRTRRPSPGAGAPGDRPMGPVRRLRRIGRRPRASCGGGSRRPAVPVRILTSGSVGGASPTMMTNRAGRGRSRTPVAGDDRCPGEDE